MNSRHYSELVLLLILGTLIYLTYTPVYNFWMYWATIWVFIFFGYLMDVMFCDEMSFVFDPNTDNWRRKTDPQT